MTEGYAIYRATLGPLTAYLDDPAAELRSCDDGRLTEPVTILVALDDANASPLSYGDAVSLDVQGCECIGAINLSTLRWGTKWPEGRWLLDLGGDYAPWETLIRTEGHS
jgi:hypothetical protein